MPHCSSWIAPLWPHTYLAAAAAPLLLLIAPTLCVRPRLLVLNLIICILLPLKVGGLLQPAAPPQVSPGGRLAIVQLVNI